MTILPRGANAPVPATKLRVLGAHIPTAEAEFGVDLVIALLDERGKSADKAVSCVREFDSSGAVRYIGKTWGDGLSGARVEVELGALGADIHKVMVLAVRTSVPFRALPGLHVQVLGPDGVQVVRYDVLDEHDEGDLKIFTFGEFYRRDGGWKFRAVGQGYADMDVVGADFNPRWGEHASTSQPSG
ncbi:TerD family protein [Streptomyces albipurpureus]|uniref:TerD family protein n=1 Tax=Streptomyces albipurpureus TaxID=2897419 RepID=A0ABT0UIU1_9ACTN|nr:TerD family protein [Streptomyces sp. CWNU-1]MCM2388364.1 TerD family protein [Streptomyces sp. CWNU-1]